MAILFRVCVCVCGNRFFLFFGSVSAFAKRGKSGRRNPNSFPLPLPPSLSFSLPPSSLLPPPSLSFPPDGLTWARIASFYYFFLKPAPSFRFHPIGFIPARREGRGGVRGREEEENGAEFWFWWGVAVTGVASPSSCSPTGSIPA